MRNNNVIYVVGPTASGKTSLSVELALHFNAEVVSADSMQIYKGITIASAAPTAEETKGVKHHLVEFLELDDAFSVAQYVDLARKAIDDIHSRGKSCIVTGGTGLYISSLTDNILFSDEDEDSDLRKSIEAEMEQKGAEELLSQLAELTLLRLQGYIQIINAES